LLFKARHDVEELVNIAFGPKQTLLVCGLAALHLVSDPFPQSCFRLFRFSRFNYFIHESKLAMDELVK